MTRMTKAEATDILTRHHIPAHGEFHALRSAEVGNVIAAADERKYRQPANANGSRARCFYEYLMRASRQPVQTV